MAKEIPTRPLAELHLHPELAGLANDIRGASLRLGLPIDELVPAVCPVVQILPCGTVIGNWAAYRDAKAKGLQEVPVFMYLDLVFADTHLVALRALTSVVRPSYADPVLLGLVYRAWNRYSKEKNLAQYSRSHPYRHSELPGESFREQLDKEFCRRVGKSRRDLQRLASVLDAPVEWLLLYRQCRVSLRVLERIRAMPASNRDVLMERLRDGTPPAELIDYIKMTPDHHRRRLESSVRFFAQNLPACMTSLRQRLDAEGIAMLQQFAAY